MDVSRNRSTTDPSTLTPDCRSRRTDERRRTGEGSGRVGVEDRGCLTRDLHTVVQDDSDRRGGVPRGWGREWMVLVIVGTVGGTSKTSSLIP